MFINLGNPGLSSDVDVNVTNLLEKLKKKAELEKDLAEVQESLEMFAARSYRTLKGKMPKSSQQGVHKLCAVMDLVILDKDGNAFNVRLEEFYKRDQDEDSEPSVSASFEAHDTIG